jgi:hypothetical protein
LLLDLTYHVQRRRSVNERELLSGIARVDDNQEISLVFNDQHLDV